ncbi:MAG: 30S ribosomal protein S19e [Anaerolineales bacterium]
MPTAYDVPADTLLKRLAEHLHRVPQVAAPEWASYVKTGSHAERPPQDRDWWYTRSASLVRKLYVHGPIGLADLESMYGGRKRVGYSPGRHRDGGGVAVRKGLQQLEAAGLVAKQGAHGRVLTPRGRSLLDRLATEIFKDLKEAMPAVQRYA